MISAQKDREEKKRLATEKASMAKRDAKDKGMQETLLRELPDMSNFSAGMRQALIGTYLDEQKPCSKEDVLKRNQKAIALCKILNNPRPHHLAYLSELDDAQLQDKEIVRRTLLNQVEWSKRITPTRTVIFGHLWKEIAQFMDQQTGANWKLAYPSLIPTVSLLLLTFSIHS
jgi:hypothetical protein